MTELARDQLGLVESATALAARVQRDGAVSVDGIRVALQVGSKQVRDVWDGDSHIAVLEVVDDAARVASELVGRADAVECGCYAAARFAELRNSRTGAEDAIGPLQGWQVGFAVRAEISSLAPADDAVLGEYEVKQREGCSFQMG